MKILKQLYNISARWLLLRWAQRKIARRDPKTLSFAVVSRLTIIELPYIWSFIDHYLRLGVKTLYLVNTRPSEYEEVAAYLKNNIADGYVYLFNVQVQAHVDTMQNQVLPKIKEDFIISVDIDEFLIITPHLRLHDFVAANANIPYCHLWWDMLPNDTVIALTAPYHSIGGHTGKYMIYRPIVKELGIHRPKAIFHLRLSQRPKHGRLLHFWGRSFNDVLLKVLHHRIPTSITANSSKEEVLTLLEKSDIPLRLKILAGFLMQKSKVLNSIQENILQINYELEQALLNRYLHQDQIIAIHSLYQQFKSHLVGTELPPYPLYQSKKMAEILQPIKP